MNLTCVSSFCNPKASVTWYLGGVEINSNTIDSFTNDNNGLLQTTSILQYTGVAEDNAKEVHCRASNLHNEMVESLNYELNVRCKFYYF